MVFFIKGNKFLTLYVSLSILIITISLLPLLNDILTYGKWRGYGWGGYVHTNRLFEVYYSDEFYGGDKPAVRLLLSFFIRRPVDLVEFSGHESYVCGYNVVKDATHISIVILNDKTLRIRYTYPDLNVTQEVTVLDDVVVVKYMLSRKCSMNITIWRWYYGSVLNVTLVNMKDRFVKWLNHVSRISFTFNDDKASIVGGGIVEMDKPVKIYIMRDLKGINKVGVVAEDSTEITFTVKGSLEKKQSTLPSGILSSRNLMYVYPTLALILILSLYRPMYRRYNSGV